MASPSLSAEVNSSWANNTHTIRKLQKNNGERDRTRDSSWTLWQHKSIEHFHCKACACTVDARRLCFPPVAFGWDSWGVFRWRVQSVAEGPSINNKQRLSCVGPSVFGATEPSPASERRLPHFPPLVLFISKAYKSVDVQVHPRVCVCVHSTGLLCIVFKSWLEVKRQN